MKTFSSFAHRFTKESGITELMQDLGDAINSNDPEICMLGGGNPAIIPKVMDVFRQETQALIDNQQWNQSLGYYSSPQGDTKFISALVDFLNDRYHWNLTTKNIALSNGSQNSFFYLFNLLAGEMPDGSQKKILFPLSPEYIGYRDLGLSDDMFVSKKPKIKFLDGQQFKYHINFDALEITDDIAAICVSRPTNPTGNVITDDELKQLDRLAKQHNIPLIIDNAYGLPFPGAIYTDTKLHWHDNIILSMSLSKLGLPGVRTGITIAKEEIIGIITKMNATLCLAPNNMGASLLTRLLKTKEILSLRNQFIRPFYEKKMRNALALAQKIFEELPVHIHKPEGAFFLWLWLDGLPITSKVLYRRLKNKKVLVIPGEDFFIGIDEQWPHQYQCLRINYALSDEQLERGLSIIATEVSALYALQASNE
ncbi:MAG: valine--pyruvate aminotransferase [Kiritimatiellia bacterium]|jgi:valine--pyruvate aminotransferase